MLSTSDIKQYNTSLHVFNQPMYAYVMICIAKRPAFQSFPVDINIYNIIIYIISVWEWDSHKYHLFARFIRVSVLLIALYGGSNTLNLYIEHIRLSNPLLFNGNNAESDFWTTTIASSHSLPINVHTTTYMVTGSHTPTSYRIHMRSMPAVYNMFQALLSLLFQPTIAESCDPEA